ncbi:hypothetical protein D3C73_1417990 [compost metagenome]
MQIEARRIYVHFHIARRHVKVIALPYKDVADVFVDFERGGEAVLRLPEFQRKLPGSHAAEYPHPVELLRASQIDNEALTGR